ncbi:hypothetical protein AQ1_02447 [alpha proteobacterium Q-1]|nr:hypothetical protein AQ1_02447 [alpha proteobacterium Q-1]
MTMKTRDIRLVLLAGVVSAAIAGFIIAIGQAMNLGGGILFGVALGAGIGAAIGLVFYRQFARHDDR